MPENHVVAHLGNGTLLKGTTQDFFPNRPSFHIVPGAGRPPVEVECTKLKALFFVKDLSGGKPRLSEPKGFLAAPSENAHGKKVAVLFRDGELICGYSLAYVPGREGFFMVPAESDGNNLRV